MSLGEVSQISEGIYAYLQPDGSWWVNNTGFLVSPGVGNGVISVDATSTERRTRAYLDAIAAVTHQPVRTLVNTDLGLALADMVAYNGGRPLTCHA
jgi:cyclase